MDFQNIEAEKAKAMSRYRRIQTFGRIWLLLEVFVALTLLSWSSIRLPNAAKNLSRDHLRQLTDLIFNPHINFVVGNAIIIALFLLSRQNNAGKETNTGGLPERLRETVSVTERETQMTSHPAPAMEEAVVEEKRIVVSENAEAELQCDAVFRAIEDATKQIRRFERTQSAKLKRDLRTKPCGKFRRSETEIVQRVATADKDGATSSYVSVEELSSEEFRRKIEEFIEKQQRFLWAQKMAEKNQ